MTKQQEFLWALFSTLTGEEVARLLTDYHGMQLVDDGLLSHVKAEGYLETDDEEE